MKKNNNFFNFIFYTLTIILISGLFILKITIKNECLETQSSINKSKKMLVKNKDIVKELQSSRDYLMSYQHIQNILSEKMIAAVPETLIINMQR